MSRAALQTLLQHTASLTYRSGPRVRSLDAAAPEACLRSASRLQLPANSRRRFFSTFRMAASSVPAIVGYEDGTPQCVAAFVTAPDGGDVGAAGFDPACCIGQNSFFVLLRRSARQHFSRSARHCEGSRRGKARSLCQHHLAESVRVHVRALAA